MHNLIARKSFRQFVKFGLVGLSGLFVNACVYWFFQTHTAWPHWLDFSVGFMLGGVSNFILNRVWTFRSDGHAGREGAQFLTVSLVALLLGQLIFFIFEHKLHYRQDKVIWLLATGSGILVNFFANKYWTFRNA